jgi:hypothetical protein
MAHGSYLVGSLPNVRFYRNLFNLIVARDWHYQDSGVRPDRALARSVEAVPVRTRCPSWQRVLDDVVSSRSTSWA